MPATLPAPAPGRAAVTAAAPRLAAALALAGLVIVLLAGCGSPEDADAFCAVYSARIAAADPTAAGEDPAVLEDLAKAYGEAAASAPEGLRGDLDQASEVAGALAKAVRSGDPTALEDVDLEGFDGVFDRIGAAARDLCGAAATRPTEG
ncbi:MAG: hypothetical protein LBT54_01925 [Bifidobacteriaceae bacterium]|jgi:hypothetical protein|nr:hypothetical protein [Bifidobacteriaceae bacterium]